MCTSVLYYRFGIHSHKIYCTIPQFFKLSIDADDSKVALDNLHEPYMMFEVSTFVLSCRQGQERFPGPCVNSQAMSIP